MVFHWVGGVWRWKSEALNHKDLLFFLRAEYVSTTDNRIILVFLASDGAECRCHADHPFSEDRHSRLKDSFEPVTE